MRHPGSALRQPDALEHPWPAHSSGHSIGRTSLQQARVVSASTLQAQLALHDGGWELSRA